MRIYLDNCCLNRPFDDQSQDRIHLEAEAVLRILDHVESGDWSWIGSEALDHEIQANPDFERRRRVSLLTSLVHETTMIGQAEIKRAKELEGLGFDGLDSLHMACAEKAKVDVFLTTDDRLLRTAHRLGDQLLVEVANPLAWINKGAEK